MCQDGRCKLCDEDVVHFLLHCGELHVIEEDD